MKKEVDGNPRFGKVFSDVVVVPAADAFSKPGNSAPFMWKNRISSLTARAKLISNAGWRAVAPYACAGTRNIAQ